MKKVGRNLLIGFLILFGVLRLSGVLAFFNIPSTSNEPNLKLGAYFIGSNLIKPKTLDFGYFKFSDSVHGNTIVKRLIAEPNDKLECKNGVYFVNEVNVDEKINLRYSYVLHKDIFEEYIKPNISKEKKIESIPSGNGFILCFLDEDFVKSLPVKINRSKELTSMSLSKDTLRRNPNWNHNNFGPLTMPKGKYFFLGDSRDNSFDSRYRGFVDEENIKGALIIQF